MNTRIFTDRLLGLFFLTASLPLWILFYLAVACTSKGNFLFKQKRIGKNKRIFTMYKIRTMIVDAEKLKKKYLDLNEADGPVFKIRNDPRFTKVGRLLAKTGLDELPQLINVIKGEMSLVGPRPLPVEEARKIPKKYQKRFSVLPGITSLWVIKGTHRLSFDEWMKLDITYIKKGGLAYDMFILYKTMVLILMLIFFKKTRHEEK